jgi:predicted MFS family arabinose efflux permease
LPSIKADLKLSDGQLGFLIGLAFSIFYAACAIPIARWADRGTRRTIIVIALATWSVMTALSGAAQTFWQIFAARVGVGAGEAGCLPPAQSIICDYVPLTRRSGAFAIHTFGLIVGMMLGMALAGWLAEAIGWRWTFVALGLPGLALAAVVKLTLREPVRGFFDAAKDDSASSSSAGTIGFLWRCKTYRWLTVVLVVNGFYQFGLTSWWPTFYVRLFGLSVSSVGAYLGIAIGVGSGIGLLLGGLLANRAARRDVRLPLIIGAAGTLAALPVVLAALFLPSAVGSILLVSLTTLLWNVAGGPVVATVYSVTRSRMRATAGAITIFFTSVLGFGLGPFCVGLLSDLLAPTLGREALRYALLAPVCLLPVMAIALRTATKTLSVDLRAAGVQVGSQAAGQSASE